MNTLSWIDLFGCLLVIAIVISFSAGYFIYSNNTLNLLAVAFSVVTIFTTGVVHVFLWLGAILFIATNFMSESGLAKINRSPTEIAQLVAITTTTVTGAVFVFDQNMITRALFATSMALGICFIVYGLVSSKNRAL